MSDLSNVSTAELQEELKNRKDVNYGRCKCGKWALYMGCSTSWKEELHCSGCRRPQEDCVCSHG